MSNPKQRDVKGTNSWVLERVDYEAARKVKYALMNVVKLNSRTGVPISLLYKLPFGQISKELTHNYTKYMMVKYLIMRWLWLGKVRVHCNNGKKIIIWKDT